jgi:transcriptional regulator
MFTPEPFEETDVRTLHQLARSHPLGALVAMTPHGLEANHIPFLLHADPAPYGTLNGHVARANPVSREHSEDIEVLVIFQGPQTYITPSWYPSKREHGKVVPTWTYAVVHAHGHLRVIDDAVWTRAHLEALVSTHEAAREVPWRLADAPADFLDKMVTGVVGLEIPISRLAGKWKVSQNRLAPDRDGVVQGLMHEATDPAAAMAKLVRERGEAR